MKYIKLVITLALYAAGVVIVGTYVLILATVGGPTDIVQQVNDNIRHDFNQTFQEQQKRN